MAIPDFTMRELLQAGVHFGHYPRRWNPKMKPYIFGVRNKIHIINLEKTYPLLERALQAVHDVVSKGGRLLFVGTKRQASKVIADEAKRCGQYYMNHRWLGGTMTNWKTISNSIRRLRDLEKKIEEGAVGLTKKEALKLNREYEKLELSLGGIKDMGGVPDLLFVVDSNKEKIALEEAKTLGIPVISVLDTNSDPDGIEYPIPGNDDAIRSIELYCRLISSAALEGLQTQMSSAGVDLGASAELPEQFKEPKKMHKPVAPAPKKAVKKEAKTPTPVAGAPEGEEAKVEAPKAATPVADKPKAEKNPEKKEEKASSEAPSEEKAPVAAEKTTEPKK